MVDINLKELISELKGYPGITRKRPIKDVIKSFPQLNQTTMGIIVLADFGGSKIVKEDVQQTKAFTSTPAYTPPESLSLELNADRTYTAAADVYAFGVLLWELVTRQVAYADVKDNFEVSARIVNGQIPQMPHDCPPEITDLYKACCHLDKTQRPTMQQVYESLSTYCNSMQPPDPGQSSSIRITI